jgi:hypothetical protein
MLLMGGIAVFGIFENFFKKSEKKRQKNAKPLDEKMQMW